VCQAHVSILGKPPVNESIPSNMKIHISTMLGVLLLFERCSAELPQARLAASSVTHRDSLYDARGVDMPDKDDGLLLLQTRSKEKRTEIVGDEVEDWEEDNLKLLPQKNIIFCACAKCGSTSLYRFIYQQLFGSAWPHKKEPYIQEPSYRWESKLQGINSNKALTLMNTSREPPFSLAFMRDPRERLISAWKSKVACDADCWGTDKLDRQEMVPALLHLAGMVRQECLSFASFIAALRTIHEQDKAWELNRHFIPQNLDCFRDIPIDRWSLATDISDPDAAKELSARLGTAKVSSFPVHHKTPQKQKCVEEVEQPDIADALSALTEAEYRALHMDPKKHSDLDWLKRELNGP